MKEIIHVIRTDLSIEDCLKLGRSLLETLGIVSVQEIEMTHEEQRIQYTERPFPAELLDIETN